MTFGICLSKKIEAAHYLTRYKGKQEPVHGHTWKIEVIIEGPLNQEEYVVDFVELECFFDNLNKEFNHSCFNDHPHFKEKNISPTTENISYFYFSKFKKYLDRFKEINLKQVNVWEGHSNYAFCKE